VSQENESMTAANSSPFESVAWYGAVTLLERLALSRTTPHKKVAVEVDDNLSAQRLQSWKSQPPFDKDAYFARRLSIDGITEEDFRRVLGEPLEAVRARFSEAPAWLTEIEEAFSRPQDSRSGAVSFATSERARQLSGFMAVIEPLINVARDRLHEGIKDMSLTRRRLPFDPERVVDMLAENLFRPLVGRLNRTLILELNVARLQGQLTGETPEQRFESFIRRLHEPDNALAILEEYPVLSRQVIIFIKHWATSSLEFLTRLCADWETIVETFCDADDPGVLSRVEGGAGDSHRGGRSVLIATFSSGFRVVYKPRSLAVDIRFQELLKWLNEHGAQPPLATMKVLDKDAYGWMEFVAGKSCDSIAEVKQFYRRQGSYLALLYALEATDFHFENLIAAGEYPFLIDLEALFQPRVEGEDIKQTDLLLASNTAAHSVLRVGLLPQRILSKADYDGIDMSGLGSTAGQLSPDRAVSWEHAGTDEMRVVRERLEIPQASHRPTLDGADVNVLNYREALAAGFTHMYRLLLSHRDELLSESGTLARFAETEVRVIVRPTRTYGLLLHESFHPDFLRDSLDRERFFDQLWIEATNRPFLEKVIAAERRDLLRGDIPIFTTRPEARHLWNSFGEQLTNFFDEPGLALVHRRVQQLCEPDLQRQLWFLNASLTTLSIDLYQEDWPRYTLVEPRKAASTEQLLAEAKAIGDRLDELALRSEKDVIWFGVAGIDGRHCSLASLGYDLYEGIPGVALFLAYLGAVSGEERYSELARLALMTLRRQVQRSKATIERIGAYAGWGGIIYTFAHLGALWNDPKLFVEAEGLIEQLLPRIEQDETFDIINGCAGALASLLVLYKCRPAERTLHAALKCGDRLIDGAQKMERGIGWETKVSAKKLPSGFSHGAAGIAWSLMELSAMSGETRFRTAALAGMEYERSLFSPECGAWVDWRDLGSFGRSRKTAEQPLVTTWCYGAPGIGLARLNALRHVDDEAIRAEAEAALQITLEHGFSLNHSLCHGDLGNLELILQASQLLDDSKWRFQVNRLTAIVLESIGKYGWLCGIPLGVESPGLMTGLAGIGYQLWRLAEPKRVPSVLTLAPPVL